MKIRRLLAGIGALCLAAVLVLPVSVRAAEESSGTTTITTTVPDTHTVTLEIGEHGSVTTDGKVYTGTQNIQVKRLAEQKYIITPDKGWLIDTVTYGKPDSMETVALDSDNTYTAPALYEDGYVLAVKFVKDSAGKGAKTGDDSTLGLWVAAAGLSMVVLFLGTRMRRKRIQ